jgi:ADP-ribosylglycohydrolase
MAPHDHASSDCFTGLVLGAAVGDSLGLPAEGMLAATKKDLRRGLVLLI